MKKALLVFSGGQDSTTCLAWALKEFDEVFALSFDYGQRHKIELEQAQKICKDLNIEQEVMEIDIFSKLSKNALTHDLDINAGNEDELPSTFVPGRNQIFLSIACIKAYQLGTSNVVTGVCQTDYSGYPDCRDDFIQSLAKASSLAMDTEFVIHTPLMWKTKAESVQMMQDLAKLDWLKDSHTCYEGHRPACGKCPACELRLKGFAEAGLEDPLEYVNKNISQES
jgi:7-cyano-7-deazaguanine synthase